MANIQGALAGTAAGFLGGYRDVLKLKMDESVQARRDEALYNRTKNLKELEMAQQQSQFKETKDLQYAQLDAQKEHYTQQYNISKQQLAAQQEAAAASRANSSASLQEQIRHHKALEDASDPVKQYDKGMQVKEKELSSIKDPEEKALFESSGFITYKEYQIGKSKMNADVVKERADIAAKAIEGVEKAVEASGKDVIEYGAELGVKGKNASDIMAQLKYHAAASSIASYDAAMGRGPKIKEQIPTTGPATQAPIFSDVAVKNYASAIIDANSGRMTEEQAAKFNSEVLPNYKKLTPEQQEEIKREINSRKSRPGVLRGFTSDIYNAFSGE